jgi:hypothetical protein
MQEIEEVITRIEEQEKFGIYPETKKIDHELLMKNTIHPWRRPFDKKLSQIQKRGNA